MKHFLKVLVTHIIYFVVMVIMASIIDQHWIMFLSSLFVFFVVCEVEERWLQVDLQKKWKKWWLYIYWISAPFSTPIRVLVGIYRVVKS